VIIGLTGGIASGKSTVSKYLKEKGYQIFDADKIRENAQELIQALIKLKPTAAKGTYVKSIYLSSTMSPGIAIDTKSVN